MPALLGLLCIGLAPGGCQRDGARPITIKIAPPALPEIQPPARATPTPITAQEAETVRLINLERQKHGLGALAVNPTLTRIAREYSALMGRENFFSHYDKNGHDIGDRAKANDVRYRMLGENLFKSINAPAPVTLAVEGWMKSEGHRANILTPQYTQTGVGIWRSGATYYFTQIFLLPR